MSLIIISILLENIDINTGGEFHNETQKHLSYSPTNGKNRSIEYRGKQFFFEDGKPIGFFNYELLLELIEDYNHAIFEIVMYNEISSIGHVSRLHKK